MPRSRQPKEIWDATRRRVWERDGRRCQSPIELPLCRGKPTVMLEACHVDHIRSGRLGTNGDDNLRVLCRVCHVLRADLRHRGMIAKALADGIIPAGWREFVWEDDPQPARGIDGHDP